jgi:hypothetical protein
MKKLIDGGPSLKQRFGESGRKRVIQNFAFSVFADRLDAVVRHGDDADDYHE